jgi:hypothetical protein
MLFRINTGELIEINKYNFSNDKLYYQKIMDLKNSSINTLAKSSTKSILFLNPLSKSSTKINKNK